MSTEVKKCYRFYTLTDYEKEEQWLREMANQGWLLKDVNLIVYTFIKTEPKDIVYKLDFQNSDESPDAEYLQMLEDYGWTYLFALNHYRYLYKEATGIEGEDEIYTDNESKYEMLKRIIKYKMLPILAIFLVCVIPGFKRVLDGEYTSTAWNVFWITMMIIYILIIGKVAIGYGRLFKKYHPKD